MVKQTGTGAVDGEFFFFIILIIDTSFISYHHFSCMVIKRVGSFFGMCEIVVSEYPFDIGVNNIGAFLIYNEAVDIVIKTFFSVGPFDGIL